MEYTDDQRSRFMEKYAIVKRRQIIATVLFAPFMALFAIFAGVADPVSGEAFDACGKKGMADLADANAKGTLFGSMAHGHAAPAAVKNAMYDVITAHFNGEFDSAAAVEELVAAVEGAM